MQVESTWPECLRRLIGVLSEEDLKTYIRPLQPVASADTLTLLAPNRLVMNRVRDHHLTHIRRALVEILPYDVVVHVALGGQSAAAPTAAPLVNGSAAASAPAAHDDSNSAFSNISLNPRYTLDAFIEGRSNSQARAAAQYVATAPGGQYNPLLIYGESGLGKTHLMQGVGHAILGLNARARVVYIGAEQWLNHFTQAIRAGQADAFKNHYRTVDALLIDDIHFIAGKERTQEEFFHTFNALIDTKKQIVLTCDRYPKELEGLDDRLKTRFSWGLSVPVEPPDEETRAAILIAKADVQGIRLPPEVARLVAKRVRSNVRELEGALNRLVTLAKLSGSDITLDYASECLRDMFAVHARQVTIENIKKEVASYYNIPVRDFMSKRRNQSLARPRQIAMALAKELTQHSLTEIGEAFDRDHTTVMHACGKVNELKASVPQIREDVLNLQRRLTN